MTDLNKGKNKWGLVMGPPNLDSSFWRGKTPNELENKDCWYGTGGFGTTGSPTLYATKADAEIALKREGTTKYHWRVQKYNPHKPLNGD
jgi:hypothetical protein